MLDKLTVEKAESVKAGEVEKNEIFFHIRNTGTEPLGDLLLRITIPCGGKVAETSYLLRSVDDSLALECTPHTANKKNKVGVVAVKLETTNDGFDLDVNGKLTIRIYNFQARDEGKAPIEVVVVDEDGKSHKWPFEIEIKKADGVKILDFTASQVIEKGSVKELGPASSHLFAKANDRVHISGTMLNAKKVQLIRGGALEPPQKLTISQKFEFEEKVTATTTYELIAYEGDTEDSLRKRRSVEVTVKPANTWQGQPLMSGDLYPSLLLSAVDLASGNGRKVYGVFVDPKSKDAELYSSTSGVDNWEFLTSVPKGMGESPGVIHDGKLWLIGGSATDPQGPRSNRVCSYYKKADGTMGWKDSSNIPKPSLKEPALGPPPPSFAPRNCHACAVFEGKIWVLGGLSGNDGNSFALRDVWTCESRQTDVQRNGNEITTEWKGPRDAEWLPRCMFAVATTKDGSEAARMWIYGGTTHPYEPAPINELWYTEGGEWEKYGKHPKEPMELRAPLGAILFCGDDNHLYLGGIFAGKGPGEEQSIRCRYSPSRLGDQWGVPETHPLGWKLQDMFLVRTVEFDDRRIFWPLSFSLDEVQAKERTPQIHFL